MIRALESRNFLVADVKSEGVPIQLFFDDINMPGIEAIHRVEMPLLVRRVTFFWQP